MTMNLDLIQQIPHQVAIFFLAMVPVLELSGVIPAAITIYKVPAWEAFFFAVTGNYLATAILVWGLEPMVTRIERGWPWLHKVLQEIFKRTRSKHSERLNRLGHWMLFLFTALPIPVLGIGGWTGALIVYLFGMNKRQGFFIICAGLGICASILSLASAGVVNFFEL